MSDVPLPKFLRSKLKTPAQPPESETLRPAMSDLTDRLRGLYVTNGTNYVQEAADEIDRLRVQCKMLQDDKAALRETQAKFGQVQHDLFMQIDALREEVALAETVRVSQVAGLTEGAEKLREEVARLTKIIDDAWGEA